MLQLANTFSTIYTDFCGPFSVVVAALAYFKVTRDMLGRFGGAIPLTLFVVMLGLFSAYLVIISGAISDNLTVVADKTFIRERVPLAGYAYRHCRFINANFVLDGKGKSELTHNDIIGPFTLTTATPEGSALLERANLLGALRYPFMDGDDFVKPMPEHPGVPTGSP